MSETRYYFSRIGIFETAASPTAKKSVEVVFEAEPDSTVHSVMDDPMECVREAYGLPHDAVLKSEFVRPVLQPTEFPDSVAEVLPSGKKVWFIKG